MSQKRKKRERRERRAAEESSSPRGRASEKPAGRTSPRPSEPLAPGSGLWAAFSRRDALALAVLALGVFAAYFPTLDAGYIWDDVIFTEEPVIRQASGLWNIWFSPADIKKEGHYWPMVYSSFWLEYRLWGLWPFASHLINVGLHFANVALLWSLLRRLAVPGAWAIAAVFAVHPLHVESVAWVIERKDLLSGLFYLAAVGVWLNFDREPGRGRYLGALALFVAALFSKSVAVTLPAALLVLAWWKRGRVSRIDVGRMVPFFAVALAITLADLSFYASREKLDLDYSLAERTLIAARALWFYVAKLAWPTDLAVIYPLWEIRVGDPRAWAYLVAALAVAAGLWSFRHRIGRGPLAAGLFFAITLSPTLGFVDYGFMQFAFVADRFQYLAGIGALGVWVGAAARGGGRLPKRARRAAGALLGAAVLALLGTLTWKQSQRLPGRDRVFRPHRLAQSESARRAPQPGRRAARRRPAGRRPGRQPYRRRAASGLRQPVLQRRPGAAEDGSPGRGGERGSGRPWSAIRATATLCRTWARSCAAGTAPKKRWRRTVGPSKSTRSTPRGMRAWATRCSGSNATRRPSRPWNRAFALSSGHPFAAALHALEGRVLRRLGRLDAAAEAFERALELEPRHAELLGELAELQFAQGRPEQAEAYLRRARELDPDDPATLQTAAEVLRKQERYPEALEAYRSILETVPDFAPALAGLGDVLYRLERPGEAAAALERAVSLDPDAPFAGSVHRLLGQIARESGRTDRAIEHFERAVELDPRDLDSIDHLALLRFERRQYSEALEGYRRMLELGRDTAAVHSNVGASLFYLNRPREALRSFERALERDPDHALARTGIDQLNRLLPTRDP